MIYYYVDEKIMLPKLQNVWENYNYHIVWKIRIGHTWSNSYLKFTIKTWMEVSLIEYENHSFIYLFAII